ncbi:hypothetical protein [Streptomyces africanus]|uniref:ADDT family thymidine hypermodification transferase n=1 Tax=Streptomyces africanus TaxID=231024 RepID=UPI000A3BD4CE|nr:hypothetical protein [Streptomyces africanus]
MSEPNSALLDDYLAFHRLQTSTRDMDPVYPVLRQMADSLSLTDEQRVWLVVCHVAYYHLGSALRAFAAVPDPARASDAVMDLPVATERRGHWSRRALHRHLSAVQQVAREDPRGLSGWLMRGLDGGGPRDNWAMLSGRLLSIPGNGRWAAFKTCEMLQQVCGANVAAPDMGHAHSSGPRKGLGLLYSGLPSGNGPAAVRELNRVSDGLVSLMAGAVPSVSVETAETSLCDFHSMSRGGYYPGHDIDKMQHQLDQVPSELAGAAYAARLQELPRAYLGELNGWNGVDAGRRKVYRDTGRIPERTPQ